MQNHTYFSRMLLRSLLLCVALSSMHISLRAQGVQDLVVTTPTDNVPPIMLLVNNPEYGNFASPRASENSRLQFTITDPSETINLGLSPLYDDNGILELNNNEYTFTIFNENDVQQIRDTVDIINANVRNFNQADFGRYRDNDAFTFSNLAPGDYYIEFRQNVSVSNSTMRIGFWDITVSDAAGQEIPGRVWSRNWAFRTPPDYSVPFGDACIWNRPFEGTVYSYTGDSTNTEGFVSEIDFSESGFIGLNFNLAFNSRGPRNTGDIGLDRQSLPESIAETIDLSAFPEYRVFLSAPPDPQVFQSAAGCAEITFDDQTIECDGEEVCFPANIGGPGLVEMVIDLDLDEEFTPNSRDRILAFDFEAPADTCLAWDRLDANGVFVPPGVPFNVVFIYSQGVQHFAGFDIEFMTDGFCVETVFPDPSSDNCFQAIPGNPLYWDDRLIMEPDSSGTSQPLDGRNGCDGCRIDSCRTWINFDPDQNVGCDTLTIDNIGNIRFEDQLTDGYGDRAILNTWWYAYSEKIIRNVSLFGCSVGEPTDTVCAGSEVILTAEALGGIAPFTYLWTGPAGDTLLLVTTDSSSVTQTITPTDSITYNLFLTDAIGCTSACEKTIIVVDGPSLSLDGPTEICFGETATYAVIDSTGTSGPFSFSWSGPNNFMSTDSVITVGTSGEYSVVVATPEGCEVTLRRTLTVEEEFSCTVGGPTNICFGETATYAPILTNGRAPFSFEWRSSTDTSTVVSTDSTLTVGVSGTYSVRITDALGCTTECNQTLTVAPEFTCTVTGPEFICVGDSTVYGVDFSGGVAPITVSWTGPEGFTADGPSVTVSVAGEYCATATDADGCMTECCQTLGFFAELSCAVEGPTDICLGETATYTVAFTNGVGPFTYAWTGPEGFTSSDSLVVVDAAGEYCVLVTDSEGCETECCQTLTVNDEFSCTVEGPTEICFGDTATYTASLTNGLAPFSYEWRSSADSTTVISQDSSLTVSTSGTYTVLVTDALGCTTECSQTLTVNDELAFEISGLDTLCAGNGSFYSLVGPDGGTFLEHDRIDSLVFTGPNGQILPMEMDTSVVVSQAGEYCLTISYDNGCTAQRCKTLNLFEELSCTVEGPSLICAGDSATYTVTVTNATAPFTVTWFGPDGFFVTADSLTVSLPGNYFVQVTDANGCMNTSPCGVTLTVSDAITAEILGPSMICVGETATYNTQIDGGTEPYSLSWTGPGGFTSTDTTIVIDTAGEYCLTVTDANGCMSGEECQTLSFFPDISCVIEGPTQICADETATYAAVVMGGTAPFTYNWSGPGGFTSTDSSVTVSDAGEYTVVVTDANGCDTECTQTLEVIDINVTLTAADAEILFGLSTTLTANASGCMNCVYTWTGPDGPINADGPTIEVTPGLPLPDNGEYTYTVTVSDDGLCPVSTSITISVFSVCDPDHVYLPNAFTPNGDDLNDVLRVETLTPELYANGMELMIYNRWGEEVFRTTDIFAEWDGTFRNEALPPDVYGYWLRVVCPEGNDLIQKGNITLLR
jgi:gliding motility-associated-like protein